MKIILCYREIFSEPREKFIIDKLRLKFMSYFLRYQLI